ncbi:MAG: homoserine kinase [Euryarchaeota archaeon]|nr:homoserine kinase [Euryarchaeota archaeon]
MIKVISPATSANLGSGFDVFALALSSPADEMRLREIEEGVRVRVRGYRVPESARENIAGYVASRIISSLGVEAGVEISIRKRIRPKSGLGSSAASAVGAAFGLNELFELGLSREEVLRFALMGEHRFSGAEHADNVSACLYGGFTCVSYSPLRVLSLRVPEFLEYAAVLPEVEVETRRARAVLPGRVPLRAHVLNLGSASFMVAGIVLGDREAIRTGMRDEIATPLRSGLIPHFEGLREAALRAGALGLVISGSGPACLALCDSSVSTGEEVAGALADFYRDAGVECSTYSGKPGSGCKVC